MQTSSATPISFYEHLAPQAPVDESSTQDAQWHPIKCAPESEEPIISIKVVTWNIWFDKVEQRKRFEAALKELLAIPELDIVCLQEVTKEFLGWLQSASKIRADWILTDRWDVDHFRETEETWYGCMFLVNRKWRGNVRAWVQKFPTSKMKRFVIMAEFFQGDETMIRVSNAHTDSPYPDVEEREKEAEICIELLHNSDLKGSAYLTHSTLFIYSGDLNTVTTAELNYITSRGFKDSITSSEMDSAVESEGSSTIGLTFGLPEYAPRRSDFILYEGDEWKCVKHIHFAEQPMLDSEGTPLPCERGMHGYLYPSDHLAVMARFIKII